MGVAHSVYVRHLCLRLEAVHARHAGDGESTFVRPSEGRFTGGQLEVLLSCGVETISLSFHNV